MLRFRCPQCQKTIKLPEEKAGGWVRCTHCKQRSRVPVHDSAEDTVPGRDAGSDPEPRASGRQTTSTRDEARALFSGMNWREWTLVIFLAGVGLLSLVSAVVASVLPGSKDLAAWTTPLALLLVPATIILLSIVLHGHATGCPGCSRWWVRRKDETEFMDREVFDKGGVSFARATYRTTYECIVCRHRWTADHTDEYKDFIREKPRRQRLDEFHS